jgi:hypothetical protein
MGTMGEQMADGDDLRIDATGTVHPLGRRASQELRARTGEWRLLASPRELVLAVRAGEASRPLRLAGELRTPGALCDIVATIAQGSWGGELVVHDGEAVRSIYFDRGNVVGASTSVPTERLGEILWRFGAITRSQLDEVLQLAEKSGKRLGETAVELEFVEPEELFRMMSRQVEEVFYGAVRVGRATFYLFDGFDESRLARRQMIGASGLLMEAARRMDELQFFREKIPGDTWVPRPLPTPAAGKPPPPELAELLSQCDGRRSVAEIGRRIGQLEFEVTRGIFQLLTAGLVAMSAPRPEGAATIVDAFNAALVEVHLACDQVGKGRELRLGVDQFASGTGVYSALFSGAGPLPDGTLRGERIARNVVALAGEDSPDAWLTQQLFEYTGFALFHAGSLLPRDVEAALNARIAETLNPFRQQPEAGPPTSARPAGVRS